MIRRKIPPAISVEDLNKMIELELFKSEKKHGIFSFVHYRNAFMYKFNFLMQGLRPKEMFGALVDDLDMIEKKFYIRGEDNKLCQQDYQPIPQILIDDLKVYLNVRTLYFSHSPYLFPSSTKEGCLDRSTWSRIFRDDIKELNIYKVNYIDKAGRKRANYNCYSIRHGFGTYAIIKTKGNLYKVKVMMRHKWIGTTMKYIWTAEKDLRKDYVGEIF